MTIAAGLLILAWFWVLCALMLADLEEAREVGAGCAPPESVTTAAGANTTRSLP